MQEALPDMLFQMAWFLVGLTTELALVWPLIALHLKVLLENQARILGWDEAWCEQATCGLPCEKTFGAETCSEHTETSTRNQLHSKDNWSVCTYQSQWWGWVPAEGYQAEVGYSWTLWLCWFFGETCVSSVVSFWSEKQCVFSCGLTYERSCHSEGRGKGVHLRKMGERNCTFGELVFRELDWFWHMYLNINIKRVKK